MIEPPRSLEQRTADVLARLRGDVDLWVASADADGDAHRVPRAFVWDGEPHRTQPGAGGLVALGLTRDVVMLDGVVEAIAIGTDPALEEAHAAATGFDPRAEPEEYVYLRITPREIQAWREANELSGRKVMRAGRWLAEAQAPPDVP